ncbi:PREDICTED: ribosome-binding protein 1-like isoform X7 [Acropora digitifera]|uniref:ribosome-binding protein 1-like isoform X7 n=1 Tax=Acropora digitifera TaxID=70779 RepID=UPI00077AC2C9|nr:PREDICTED: ribosome-binding protein 1-like isoform X7 [Acropora digitifera]
MQPLDPVTLALVAVVIAVVLSALLLLLFASREEKFEDVLAAQRSRLESYQTRATATKTSKTRKKFSRGKKKHSEDRNVPEEISELVDESAGDASPDIVGENSEFLPTNEVSQDIVEPREEKLPDTEQGPISEPVKERQGKKKQKKTTPKEDNVVELPQRVETPREVVEEAEVKIESLPTLESENLEIEEQKLPERSETVAAVKISKDEAKVAEDKGAIQGNDNSKSILEMLVVAELDSSEIQDMIDVLLNKQGEDGKWKKSSVKGDTVEILKKQLQEKEDQILEERQQSQNAANRLKEMREEFQKQKTQQASATNKITAQAKEIQALQARMQASHESHTVELQTVQSQMLQLQDAVASSSMGSMQRLQEENAQLKNASMRAAQLTADKESLTAELNKLQQSYRNVKGDLSSKVDQLSQSEANRRSAEEKVRQLTVHQNSVKEAENVLSKRLAEVNDELNKSQARNSSLQNDLNDTKQLLKAEELKSNQLSEQVKGLAAADSLTAKLQEATSRVSELEDVLTGFEHQLKVSQETQLQKDKEIQVLQEELRLAQEQVQTSVADEVNAAPPTENGKKPESSANVQEDLLKVKEDVIAELHGNVLKKDEEISSLKSLLDEQKNKNNDLRQKNWKAMEALSEAEKTAQAQINKALEAAKAATESMTNGQNDMVKEKDEAIRKLQTDFIEKKEECTKLEAVIQKQKEKNNELREKNWKAMDALSEMEKNVNSKVKTAVQKIKDENKALLIEEQNATKNALCGIYPEITVDGTLPFKSWLEEFEKQATEVSNASKELEELTAKFEDIQTQKDTLQAECAHYKVTLQETETLLRRLEDNVESEMGNWQKIVERTQRELKEANSRISILEADLQKTKSSASSQLDTIASLEDSLKDARAAESEAKQRFTELQEQLEKSTVSEDTDKVRELENEIEVLRAQEKELKDTISNSVASEKDLRSCKEQLETKTKELAEQDSELRASKSELVKIKEVEEELKKKVSSLEEALAKAENELGKSQKDKEKEEKQFEEAQRKIMQQQAEIDDLRKSKEIIENEHRSLEAEYKEFKRKSMSVDTTALSPVKPHTSPSEHKPEFHGTLKPANNTDPAEDAEALRKALQGSGSDKDAVVAILGRRTNKQRQDIAASYQEKYSKNLADDLKSEFSGKIEEAIVSLMMLPECYDAVSLHDAMSGFGTDEQVLIEILSSRSYEEIQKIRTAYSEVYSGKDVVKKVKEDTGGEFRTTMMNLIEKNRDSSQKVNADLASQDAKRLYDAGEGKKGTDKAVFVEILTTRNYSQLRATLHTYKNTYKKDLTDYISDKLSGDFGTALKAIVHCTEDPVLYFAEVLEKALDKSISKTVTRIIVTRAEVDLAKIRAEYEKKTGQNLRDVIVKKMKGDLEKLLLQLLGN